jgi:uncharacterized protein YkwD
MRRKTIFVLLLLALMVGVSVLPGAPVSAQSGAARYFEATGYSVGGAFLRFFDANGGVRIFGYPISSELQEGGRTVQYFERQRFEYHSDRAGTAFEVQLGLLGVSLGRGKVSFDPIARGGTPAGSAYVPETGHSLGEPFRAFWAANGGVRVLGYPISEPVTINGLLTQYYERARLEYHPQKAAQGYGIELGHLGREYAAANPDVAARIAASPKSAPPQPPGTRVATPIEARLFELFNVGRREAGLAPVTLDPVLVRFALSRSIDMAGRDYYSHITPEGLDFVDLLRIDKIPFRFTGEVLAKNNWRASEAADRTYAGLMGSPPHRAIILDPRFNLVGIGEANDTKGYRMITGIFVQR